MAIMITAIMVFRSIKFQITAALVLQAIVLISVVFSTLYLLKLRQHDYLILNLTGQLRVISLSLIKQSENYVTNAPRDYDAYNRDLLLFNADLTKQIVDFDKIITALKNRSISAELVSYFYHSILETKNNDPNQSKISEAIQCQWDSQSRNQLYLSVNDWATFKQGLYNALGSNLKEPRLEFAANYIVNNKQSLLDSTSRLSSSFRLMMEGKLHQIDTLNKSAIIIIIFISITILTILYFKIFKPIDRTVSGFKRIANGELDYQIKVDTHNEIGDMTTAFNTLTTRINSLFKLTDGINQATDLDDTLIFLLNEFEFFLPVDWLCFTQHDPDTNKYQLSRIHSNFNTTIKELEQFDINGSFYEYVLNQNNPISSHGNSTTNKFIANDHLINLLQKNNLESVIIIPLSYNSSSESDHRAALILASQIHDAYSKEHHEFLKNTAPQISHAVSKTIGMESLIISVVEGLAKLAESRDPETGDHLYRMSHYSAIIAEQLGKQGSYSNEINSAYVRSILRFAPMHDIGKVGIGDYILLKPGALTDEERTTMQQHPTIGAEVLRRCEKQVQSLGTDIFKIGIEIAESHHEKFDGSGYPNKLVGNNIPLSARIVAVADVFDALTSKRPYKNAWSVEKALRVMNEDAGTHFDTEILNAMEQTMTEILDIYEKHKHV
jgi:response regulator RpfG family c-di-GMP phosphodiesterase/HAMP domain-containing protein